MNRILASLAIGLTLTAASSIAGEPQAPLQPSAQDGSTKAGTVRPNPESDNTHLGYVDYVGNYGEVFKLPAGDVIYASMHGAVEAINLYPDRMVRRSGGAGYEQFKPKPSDYSPENFSRLEIIQLLIIPRAADEFHSLAALKDAKIKDLRASGVKFEVIENPFFGPPIGQWPMGTFEIYVSSPYRLTQLYTATASYLCILTSGLDTAPSRAIDQYSRQLRYGLAEWLVPENIPEEKTAPRDIWANGISLHPFTIPYVWMTWATISGISCFFAWFLGIMNRWNSLRRISLSVLIFSNAGILIGGLIGLLCWPISWFAHHIPAAAMIACCFIPMMALGIGRKRQLKRAVIGTSLWAAIAAAFLGYYSTFDSGELSRYVPAYTAILCFVSYGVAGIIFGGLGGFSKENSGKTSLLALLLFTLLPSASKGQSPGNSETIARTLLKSHGFTDLKIKKEAIENLQKTGDYYNLQRVEMKGIWSPGGAGSDNDTNQLFPQMFDWQSAPTNMGKTDKTKTMPIWMQNTINRGKDLKDLNKEAYNELSKAAVEAVKVLENKEVNEIVAHSWGTEIIYNAILAGKILPPRRLIVAGMPDHDIEKWIALSKYTGTEVIVYTNPNDPIAGGPRAIGTALESARIAAKIASAAASNAGSIDVTPPMKLFDQQWASMCGGARDCNPHHRTPPPTEYKSDFKGVTHDRFEYYQAMVDNKDLPNPPVERTVFPPAKNPVPYPGSAPALKAAQDEKLGGEIARVTRMHLEEAIAENDQIAAQARAQVEIAHRAHDERVRNTYAAIARRSCANPGSITQAELNKLADPYNKDSDTMPAGLNSCETIVYMSLGRGVSAEEIKKQSTPTVAIDAQSMPEIAPHNATNTIFFVQMLPGVRSFAVASCQSYGQTPLTEGITRNNATINFSPERDDDEANRLSTGLGFCEEFLFRRLMGVIRFGNPQNITQQWVADIVNAHVPARLTPQTPVPQTPTPPSTSETSYRSIDPPSYLGRPCESYGNVRCP